MKRLIGQELSKNAVHGLCALFVVIALPSNVFADQIKVMVNHPPQSFFDTLNKVDVGSRVVLSTHDWFPPREADAWVVFFSSDKDFGTLPTLAAQVIQAAKKPENASLVRVVAHLGGDRDLTVQINYLEGTVHGTDWQGCLAGIDIASLAYQNTSIEIEEVETACKKYMGKTNGE